jgi:hypothetical protein
MVAMTEFIFTDYVSKMKESSTYSAKDLQQSSIVIVTFAAILLLVILYPHLFKKHVNSTLSRLIKSRKGKVNSNFELLPADYAQVLVFERSLKDYMQQFLPLMYQNLNYSQLANFFAHHHLYFNFLINKDESKSRQLLEALRIVTIISACMFIMAALLAAQYPENYNSCITFDDQKSCESETRYNGGSYCIWEEGSCNYVEDSIKEEMFIGSELSSIHLISSIII